MNNNEIAGTPENGSLIVKRLGEEWIVEDGVGQSLGSSRDREEAIGIARRAQAEGKGTSISIQGDDGGHEATLD